MIQNTVEYLWIYACSLLTHSTYKLIQDIKEERKIEIETRAKKYTQRGREREKTNWNSMIKNRTCRSRKNCILCIQVIELWRGNLISSTFICRKMSKSQKKKRTEKVFKRFDKDHFIDIVYKRLFQPRK